MSSRRESPERIVPLSFPVTRTALWDHRPTGPPSFLQSCYFRPPKIVIEEKALRLAHRYAEDSGQAAFPFLLVGSISVDSDCEGVTVKLERFDPGRVDGSNGIVPKTQLSGDVCVPCVLQPGNTDVFTWSSKDYEKSIKSLHNHWCGKEKVDLSKCLSLMSHCRYNSDKNDLIFHFQMDAVTMATGFKASPINPVSIVPTALSKNLAGPLNMSEVRGEPQTGYLTMDHTRKTLMVLESDPKVDTLPIIGIWVSGTSYVYDPIVWLCCLRYLLNENIQERVCSPPDAFLLIMYSPLHSKPEFYECTTLDNTSHLRMQLLTCQEMLTMKRNPQESTRMPIEMELEVIQRGSKKVAFNHALDNTKDLLLTFEKKQRVTATENSSSEDMVPRASPSPHQIKAPTLLHSCVPDVSLFFEDGNSISETEQANFLPQTKPKAVATNNTLHTYSPGAQISNSSNVKKKISSITQDAAQHKHSAIRSGLHSNAATNAAPDSELLSRMCAGVAGVKAPQSVPSSLSTQPNAQWLHPVAHGSNDIAGVDTYGQREPLAYAAAGHGYPVYSQPHAQRMAPFPRQQQYSYPGATGAVRTLPLTYMYPPQTAPPQYPHMAAYQGPPAPELMLGPQMPHPQPPHGTNWRAAAYPQYTMLPRQPPAPQVHPRPPSSSSWPTSDLYHAHTQPAHPGVAPPHSVSGRQSDAVLTSQQPSAVSTIPPHAHHFAQPTDVPSRQLTTTQLTVSHGGQTAHPMTSQQYEECQVYTDRPAAHMTQAPPVASVSTTQTVATSSRNDTTVNKSGEGDDSAISMSGQDETPTNQTAASLPGAAKEPGAVKESQRAALEESARTLQLAAVPDDIYQLLRQQDNQLKMLQAQIQTLLAEQNSRQAGSNNVSMQSAQSQSPQAHNKPRREMCSVAINTSILQPNEPMFPEQQFIDSSVKKREHKEDETLSSGTLASLNSVPLPNIHNHTMDSMLSDIVVDMPSYQSSPHREQQDGAMDSVQSPKFGESASMYAHNTSDSTQKSSDGKGDQETPEPFEQQKDKYKHLIGNIKQLLARHSNSDKENQDLSEESIDQNRPSETKPPPASSGGKKKHKVRAASDTAAATRRQIKKMGVHLEPSKTNRYTDQSSFLCDPAFLPKVNYVSMLLESDNDLSSEVDALAMKYLNDEQLSELARLRLSNPHKTDHSTSSALSSLKVRNGCNSTDTSTWGNNISFATKKYMQRYGLVNRSSSSSDSEADDERDSNTSKANVLQFVKQLSESSLQNSSRENSCSENADASYENYSLQHEMTAQGDHSSSLRFQEYDYNKKQLHDQNLAEHYQDGHNKHGMHLIYDANASEPTHGRKQFSPENNQQRQMNVSPKHAKPADGPRVLDIDRLRQLPKLL